MPKKFRAVHALQQAYLSVFRGADSTLKKQEGILTTHQVILFLLDAEDGLPSSTIAARAGMSKSRLTGLVDTLERKRLIRRQRGDIDSRQNLVYIEPEGRELLKRTRGWVNDLNAALLTDFNSEERETIKRFLKNATKLSVVFLFSADLVYIDIL